jgi:hypothetical protein
VTPELVANVWPVVDAATGTVQRFMMRAYALEAPDDIISQTLRALARSDFRMAQVFAIPERFVLVSSHGRLNGCVTIGAFQEHRASIIEPALEELEKGFTRFQGIITHGPMDHPVSVAWMPRFAAAPYLVVTVLLETADGQLIPQIAE